ncbi:MAG TPA: SurA N-terminal domain-containing protein [Candidatus Eisenbacteria bacterium]|nr:SurA N-terminal domain-containing protein [Candidatus Eisenbacteria bacterium]
MAERKKATSIRKLASRKTPVVLAARTTPSRSTRPALARKTQSSRASQKNSSSTPSTTATVQQTYLKNPRLWVGVTVVVLAVLVYACKGLFVAAVVNGQPISRLEVVNQLEKQNGKQTLGNLVVQTLVFQEAQKRGVSVSQADVDSEIKKIEDQLKGQGVTLQDALAARGLTQKDLTDQIKLQKMLDKMVGASVKVTDDDVQAYIDKNQDSLPQDLSEEDLRKQIKTQLEQQQLQEKTQTFVADLQKKAKVTYFVGY